MFAIKDALEMTGVKAGRKPNPTRQLRISLARFKVLTEYTELLSKHLGEFGE
jgi:hypothetical protein